jgi:cell division septum initiation protein DivIVA
MNTTPTPEQRLQFLQDAYEGNQKIITEQAKRISELEELVAYHSKVAVSAIKDMVIVVDNEAKLKELILKIQKRSDTAADY